MVRLASSALGTSEVAEISISSLSHRQYTYVRVSFGIEKSEMFFNFNIYSLYTIDELVGKIMGTSHVFSLQTLLLNVFRTYLQCRYESVRSFVFPLLQTYL
jgi:hypothetical protein